MKSNEYITLENYVDETCSFCVRQEKEFPGRGCMYPGATQLRVKKDRQKIL